MFGAGVFLFWCNVLAITAETTPDGISRSSSDGLQYANFLKHEFQYLDVPKVGTATVYDNLDCSFMCLNTPSCFSINLAASEEGDGKLWCELLSSDKYSNSKDLKINRNWHHFSIWSPCSMDPCMNRGTCVPNYADDTYKCLCEREFNGSHCQLERVTVSSCNEHYKKNKSSVSQVVTLNFNSTKIPVYCHMGIFGCGDGGWTLAMKIDGNKSTFHYDSQYWNDTNEYNLPGGKTGFDTQETKLPTYWNTPFSKICLGMKINNKLNFTVINQTANSLYSLIADGAYRATSLGRDTWKTLIGVQASLQLNCNREGFNAVPDGSYADTHSKARIGFIANQENDCGTCDSRIGFGTGGNPDDSNTCGNEAADRFRPDNGDKDIKAMGFILVQ